MHHISDIKKFTHCERLYYLNKNKETSFKPYLRSDESINNLLIQYFQIDKCFIGEKNDKYERFLSEINNYEWFCHPRFSVGELRVNIPFIHKVDNEFDIYFVYYGTTVKELDLVSYSICIDVLKELNMSINHVFLTYFNPNYIRNSALDPNKLFITDEYYKEVLIKDIIENYNFDYKKIIKQIENYDLNDNSYHKNKYCKQFGLCDYYCDCFPNESVLEDDSILTLVSCKKKTDMFDNGITRLKDVDLNSIDGNKVQYAQIMASRNGGLFVDRVSLGNWLDQINNDSISFIDFEWDRYLVPPYANMKPMDVLCFEFALYYYKNDELYHETYVGINDCREEFILKLLKYLPKDGPILAYNADGAEKLRLLELGRMFPQYEEELNRIVDRLVDLAIPFVDGLIYDVRMRGDYTLKKLVDIVSEYSYSKLEINNGMSAVYSWRSIDNNNAEEDTIENLKKYCSLDAYGLILVYNWLLKIIDESKNIKED